MYYFYIISKNKNYAIFLCTFDCTICTIVTSRIRPLFIKFIQTTRGIGQVIVSICIIYCYTSFYILTSCLTTFKIKAFDFLFILASCLTSLTWFTPPVLYCIMKELKELKYCSLSFTLIIRYSY